MERTHGPNDPQALFDDGRNGGPEPLGRRVAGTGHAKSAQAQHARIQARYALLEMEAAGIKAAKGGFAPTRDQRLTPHFPSVDGARFCPDESRRVRSVTSFGAAKTQSPIPTAAAPAEATAHLPVGSLNRIRSWSRA